MMGFVMAVIWKLVKIGRVCAGTRILLSLPPPPMSNRLNQKDKNVHLFGNKLYASLPLL